VPPLWGCLETNPRSSSGHEFEAAEAAISSAQHPLLAKLRFLTLKRQFIEDRPSKPFVFCKRDQLSHSRTGRNDYTALRVKKNLRAFAMITERRRFCKPHGAVSPSEGPEAPFDENARDPDRSMGARSPKLHRAPLLVARPLSVWNLAGKTRMGATHCETA